MLRKIRGGLRKKIYCSVLGCIIGPYILIVSLANHYFNHKTSTLIDNFYYDQPFSILESEKEILDVLKQFENSEDLKSAVPTFLNLSRRSTSLLGYEADIEPTENMKRQVEA